MRIGLVSVLSGLLLWGTASPAARADVLITVDKSAQRMEVSVDGQPRYTWPVSTGVEAYDTPSGSYRPFRMERSHFSKEWDDAPMPFAMFFTNQGHAIHGTNHVRSLGRAASHGCVRLSVRNAATLFNLVKAQGAGPLRPPRRLGAETALRQARPLPRRVSRLSSCAAPEPARRPPRSIWMETPRCPSLSAGPCRSPPWRWPLPPSRAMPWR
ncbi:L,D-transpeptidase [Methylobacterium sp. WL7]|uniref:L,D-transpeptidase n=1 Tax=Methylobacterium sp. WL7 TaxID=2603900 RepID=UPI001FEEAF8E|nr:L,D-transpeptidase [Methylobacterium sp. WL7]